MSRRPGATFSLRKVDIQARLIPPVQISRDNAGHPVADRLLEMKKLRDDGATYAQIGEKFGVSEGRAWRILNGNQKRPKRESAKIGRPKKAIK